MSNPPDKVIYSMVGVGKSHNKQSILKDIYLSYFYGAKIGVIGLNGSGKSSLLRILAGVDTDFEGRTSLTPGHTVGFLEQEPVLDNNKTVREIVEEGVQEIVDQLKQYDEINEKFAEPMSDDEMTDLLERQGTVQEKLDHLNAWDLDSRLEMAMGALRCPPGETSVSVISGGERRRVEITRALVLDPRFILLDEPFAGVDPIAVIDIQKIIEQLKNRGIGVVITDHNVRETLSICERAYIIKDGEILRLGTPAEIADDPRVREVYLGQNFRLN